MTVTDYSDQTAHQRDRADGREPYVLLRLSALLLRHWRLMVAGPLVMVVVAWAVTVFSAPRYTATVMFAPQEQQASALSRLSSVAAQLGIGAVAAEPVQSPRFYVDLIGTRDFLRRVVRADYTVFLDANRRTGPLTVLFEIDESDDALRVEAAVDRLAELIATSASAETGVVTVRITTTWPDLSAQVGNQIVSVLNDFNIRRRRSEFTAEREFLERRVAEAEVSVREVETQLQQFLAQNQQYRQSSQLAFEHDRLQRDLDTRRQVQETLVQSYEQARIEEVRNTPVITIISDPMVPPRPDLKHLRVKLVLGLILGMFLALVLALIFELWQELKTDQPPELDELRRLLTPKSRRPDTTASQDPS